MGTSLQTYASVSDNTGSYSAGSVGDYYYWPGSPEGLTTTGYVDDVNITYGPSPTWTTTYLPASSPGNIQTGNANGTTSCASWPPAPVRSFMLGGVCFGFIEWHRIGSYRSLDKDSLMSVSAALMKGALSGECMQTNILLFMRFYCDENNDEAGSELLETTWAKIESVSSSATGPSKIEFGEEEGEITRMVVSAAMSLEALAEELD